MDGRADPGEVIWTWVPYEEHDGRGKDRPVVIVARMDEGSVLGVYLTSKPHRDVGFVAIGSGCWDSEGRPSWAATDRILLIQDGGLRREACGLEPGQFILIARELVRRYGWSA